MNSIKSKFQALVKSFANSYYENQLTHNIENIVSSADIDKAYKQFLSTIDLKEVRQVIRWTLISCATQYDESTVRFERFILKSSQPPFSNFDEYDDYDDLEQIDKVFVCQTIQLIKLHEKIDYSTFDITDITTFAAPTPRPSSVKAVCIEFLDSEEYTFEISKVDDGFEAFCINVGFNHSY